MKQSITRFVFIAIFMSLAFSAHAGEPKTLDINLFRETFSDDFRNGPDVTAWGPSKWIAHTPWKGDFGDARFADPDDDFPFKTGPGGLTITARKDINGKWASGLLSSLDANGHGFQQTGGYFEIRMKLPPGLGVWPAFWLVAREGDKDYRSEIDIIEYYGQMPDHYYASLARWPKSKAVKEEQKHIKVDVPVNSLSAGFHTYGAEVRDDFIVIYLDRRQAGRWPTSPEAKQPMSILLNLALGSGWPIDKTPNPSVLEVDYVKAFVRK